MELVRKNEVHSKKVPFRTGRIFNIDGEWYFAKRGDKAAGPFSTHELAEESVNAYIKSTTDDYNIVSSIMTSPKVTIPPDYLARDIPKLLDEHKITCVPVVARNCKCLGMVSAANIINYFAHHAGTDLLTALRISTRSSNILSPATSIKQAMNSMLDTHESNLLVVEDSKLLGVVSAIDLLQRAREIESANPSPSQNELLPTKPQ